MDKVQGRVGSYEFIDLRPKKPDQAATLKAWLMYLPRQHPFWDYYMLGVIHLRPIEGVKPAYKYATNAEHEILVCALDPDRKPNASDVETLVPLTPLNYTVQFSGMTDEQAVKLGITLTTAFIEGGFLVEPQGVAGATQLFYNKVQSYLTSFMPGVKMYQRPESDYGPQSQRFA